MHTLKNMFQALLLKMSTAYVTSPEEQRAFFYPYFNNLYLQFGSLVVHMQTELV